jgi:hypothetical protein
MTVTHPELALLIANQRQQEQLKHAQTRRLLRSRKRV